MMELTGKETSDEIRDLLFESEVLLTRKAMIQIIYDRCHETFDPEGIHAITDMLECEAFYYETGYESVIADVLFELSTPEINGAITKQKCLSLIERLSRMPDAKTARS